MGFRKVDPDRWEFANEGFLGGQKLLLKTIKRRRNVTQNMMTQQGGGSSSCVEIGHYGMEEELKRLKRDRNLLMTEIMKLKQQQHSSRDRIVAMEERIRSTERKQQQMMSFLAKAFRSPMFLQQYMDKYGGKNEEKHIKIGQKRRLTMSPSVENLAEDLARVGQNLPESVEVENLFSAALDDDESRNEVMGVSAEGVVSDVDSVTDIWERFLSDDVIVGGETEQVLAADHLSDVEVEELVAMAPDWGEDLQELVDQLGFL